MTPEFVTTMGKEAMEVVLLVSAPMLGVAIIVGLAISIFQAVTQIQEMTLTFVPKIVAVFVALLLFFPWMLQIMLNFTNQIFVNIPNYIR